MTPLRDWTDSARLAAVHRAPRSVPPAPVRYQASRHPAHAALASALARCYADVT